MKVVINNCFGGFGISNKAIKELALMKSDVLDYDKPIEYYGGNNPKFARPDWIDTFNRDLAEKYTQDLGDGYLGDKWYNGVYDSKNILIISCKSRSENGVRTHKDLISVVEKMGREADGSHANLSVVEIPDGIEWEIDEYDGVETIHEAHRSWS